MTLLMREREIREETREEDIKKLIASLRYFNIPEDAIMQQLIERYQLTQEEANLYMNEE